jgi:hypothetical protein
MKVLLSFAAFGGRRAERARPKSQIYQDMNQRSENTVFNAEDGYIVLLRSGGWDAYFEITIGIE